MFLVLFLGVLAVFDLSVGVSNDAVNFLNASIGSKAASFRVIMIVAATGILVGAALSNGMMDIARHGIYQPQYFYFSEIMCILVAVMLTDVVLLDIFNSLGMPTSTTVSLVFELLGGTVAYALIKIANDTEGIYHLGNLMNTDKALTVILAIFVSVAIAFIFGTLVQYISRIIFTFNYKQSPAGQLTVTTDENVFPHLRFDVSNGDLQILAEEGDKVYPTRLEVKGSSAELNEVNRAPMHASFFAYADKDEAALETREKSENYMTLNGQWKFKWVRHSWQRPTGFWETGFDDTDWGQMPVPGIWELNGYGDPIYLNIGYAWRGNHSNNPPYVPEEENHVGSYRKTVNIPADWNGKEIIARDNSISIRRKEDVSKAYFHCHTDITLPYEELGKIAVVKEDGEEILLLENGRFVLPGTEILNEPLKSISK